MDKIYFSIFIDLAGHNLIVKGPEIPGSSHSRFPGRLTRDSRVSGLFHRKNSFFHRKNHRKKSKCFVKKRLKKSGHSLEKIREKSGKSHGYFGRSGKSDFLGRNQMQWGGIKCMGRNQMQWGVQLDIPLDIQLNAPLHLIPPHCI